MQESSRGADHGSDLRLHISLYAGNCLEHVRTLLIGYRLGGTPGFPRNLQARDGIAGRQRGSSACQRPGDLPALRVACRCSPVGFDRQHILARPVGLFSATTFTATMTGAQDQEPAPKPVTYEELSPEHKKKYDEIKALLEADLIGSFERTRNHGISWKGFSPEGALDNVDLSVPSEERTRALRQEMNYMVAHALHRHSQSLMNELERMAHRVIQEIIKNQYSPSGPTLGSHTEGAALHSRQQLPFSFAAPRSQSSPIYVIHKIGGDPGEGQFLTEPPKEIPHGYTFAYIPDSVSPARSVQMVNPGASGADAEKQAWLAKYATGPSAEPSAPGVLSVEQVSAILRDQFGILPKRKAIGYSKPYPSDYDLIPLPPKYRLPEFTKFNGSEGASSIEHVSRYLTQLGMISVSDPLRVRFFCQSLTGSAFGWYTSLAQIRSTLGGSWKISSTPSITQRLLKLGLPTSSKSSRNEGKVCRSTCSASEKLRIDVTHRASQKRRQSIWQFWGSLSRSRIWFFSWISPFWRTWCRSSRRMNTITLSCTRKNLSAM